MDLGSLRPGLLMTVIGMGLVFAALALLWGILVALTRLFPPRPEPASAAKAVDSAPITPETAPALIVAAIASATAPLVDDETALPLSAQPVMPSPAATLTAERGRVAALVAAALASNALPLLLDAPIGPAFEHGRTNPAWVTANRARALQRWQPPRRSTNAE
jgi:Na+-transporting methylmalonyl-CoA/oxaloacetate decarboxylase gamma subunit